MRKVLCCAGAIAGAVLAVGASAAMADSTSSSTSRTPAPRRPIRRSATPAARSWREHGRRRGDGQLERSELCQEGRRRGRAGRRGAQPGHRTRARASTKPAWRDIESERGNFQGNGPRPQPVKGDPLAGLQWDMQMINATPTGSYAPRQGSQAVRVGHHRHGRRRHAPRHRAELRQRPAAATSPSTIRAGHRRPVRARRACVDPADVDEDGHGTHVASTIGVAAQRHRHRRRRAEGRRSSTSAPARTRASSSSSRRSTRLTYAGDIGIDVVNMSFYIDPWLYNCAHNPADSPEAQAQQRTIIEATHARGNYAHRHGRHPDRGGGQRVDRPRHPDVRRHQPGLPAGRGVRAPIDNAA